MMMGHVGAVLHCDLRCYVLFYFYGSFVRPRHPSPSLFWHKQQCNKLGSFIMYIFRCGRGKRASSIWGDESWIHEYESRICMTCSLIKCTNILAKSMELFCLHLNEWKPSCLCSTWETQKLRSFSWNEWALATATSYTAWGLPSEFTQF